ncbi:MAG: transposase [Thermaceae bacterium]|nr:transposase [Thermaceae bacterium]
MARDRQSTRLREYDYTSAGAYFVTLCAQNREHLFGEIQDRQMCLNQIGEIVRTEWYWSEVVRPTIDLDAFVIVPNHVHGMVMFTPDPGVGAHSCAPLRPRHSLGSSIAQFKATTTKQINELRGAPGIKVWQHNYYERIIRDEDELNTIRAYIENNPLAWDTDGENVA